ncbi:hypothetical protein TRAPUB_8979 [Trametes pubescens]|uniref:O-acyltransferase n=1 Tax=Trametes pubescens TaxID=154538 RepID=A0A1M2W3Q7_TRAPU|nr:hypothetical protein TRAPUB_8979 [Trametes pubescens]
MASRSAPLATASSTTQHAVPLRSDAPPPATNAVAAEGTLYVSQTYRSSSNKLRAMVAFAPRKSYFDISNEHSSTNDFRGFFALFWISLFLFVVSTYVRSIETNGYILDFEFATMFSRDAITLAISDTVLVLNTGLCVPFAYAMSKGWIRYYYFGVVLQHLWQAAVLGMAITWTFHREWPWVQSGFFTLHSFVMMMKVHSYLSTNGQLAYTHREAEKVFVLLWEAADAEGGWDAALNEAEGGSPVELEDMPTGSTTSSVDALAAVRLHRRLTGRTVADATAEGASVRTNGTRILPPGATTVPTYTPTASEVLMHHPSENIAERGRTHAELELELRGPVEGRVRWPANITLRAFALYQLTPTLVYELEYPRTDHIRPLYVLEKTVAFFGTFALLYTIVETFIIPLTPTKEQSFARSLLDLALPFADRQFYDDWWNSTSWDEFSRKWNRPVHTFLFRHVYASTMSSYKLTRQSAMFITFLLSATAHELVMAIVTKKIRFYLFGLQIAQIPLIAIGRIPAIRRNKLLGNVFFWVGLYAGFPLLCVAYCAY